jgi:hypothetical protein
MIGGYVILDFNHVNITTTAKKFNGIYNEIINAVNIHKPILAKNLVVANIAYSDFFVPFIINGSISFQLLSSDNKSIIKVTITNTDNVSYSITNLTEKGV